MKLLIIILNNSDLKDLSRELIRSKVKFTKISSVGGYLKNENATLFSSVEDEEVEDVIEIVRKTCARKKTVLYSIDSYEPLSVIGFMKGVEVTTGGAVVFSVDSKNVMGI